MLHCVLNQKNTGIDGRQNQPSKHHPNNRLNQLDATVKDEIWIEIKTAVKKNTRGQNNL